VAWDAVPEPIVEFIDLDFTINDSSNNIMIFVLPIFWMQHFAQYKTNLNTYWTLLVTGGAVSAWAAHYAALIRMKDTTSPPVPWFGQK
jgi:hypothetical protein